jgi:antitoxin YefM
LDSLRVAAFRKDRGNQCIQPSDPGVRRGKSGCPPLISGHDAVQMNAITYTAARENLASTMDRVCQDHDPVIITRNRSQAVVMLSLDDYEALQETAFLLNNPRNAKRIMSAVSQLDAGKGVEREIDLEA